MSTFGQLDTRVGTFWAVFGGIYFLKLLSLQVWQVLAFSITYFDTEHIFNENLNNDTFKDPKYVLYVMKYLTFWKLYCIFFIYFNTG